LLVAGGWLLVLAAGYWCWWLVTGAGGWFLVAGNCVGATPSNQQL